MLLSFSKSILVHKGPEKSFRWPRLFCQSPITFCLLFFFCCILLWLCHSPSPSRSSPLCAHNPPVLTGQDKTSAASHRAHKGPAARSLASSRLASRPGTRLSIPVAIDGTVLTSCSDSPPPPPPPWSPPVTRVPFVCLSHSCRPHVRRRNEHKLQQQKHTSAQIPKSIKSLLGDLINSKVSWDFVFTLVLVMLPYQLKSLRTRCSVYRTLAAQVAWMIWFSQV